MNKDVYEIMAEKGIKLHKPSSPVGLYKGSQISNKLLYSSGIGPVKDGKYMYAGRLGKDLTIEEGQDAARLCIINMLSIIENEIGDLNKIKRVVKMLGFVSSSEDFFSQPKVIDGASDILNQIWGDDYGVGARSAIGVYALPSNIPVEIEVIFELK